MRIPLSKYEKFKNMSKHFDMPLSKMFIQVLDGELKDVKKIKPKRKSLPKADPELLRQLAGIGNNLNQLTRRVNQGEKIEVLPYVITIEQKMEELIELHNTCMERINANQVH